MNKRESPHPTTALPPGHTIRHQAGRTVITLQATPTGTYTVTTEQGGTLRLDEWCRTYPTEPEARTAARHTALVFHHFDTGAAVEQRRTELADRIRDELHRRPGWRDEQALTAAQRELDTLATLADLALRAAITADLTTRHAA
jgi:hypothetical protein